MHRRPEEHNPDAGITTLKHCMGVALAPPDAIAVTSVQRRILPLEAARRALRSKIVAGTLFGVALVIAAIPGGFAAGSGLGWLLKTYVSDTALGALMGYAAGILMTGYAAFLAIRHLMRRGEAAQLNFGKRWHEEVVLPLLLDARLGDFMTPERTLHLETFRASGLFGGNSDDQFDTALPIGGKSHGMAWFGARVSVHQTTAGRENSGGITSWRLRGWYFNLAHAAPWAGTVRLVEKPVYTAFVSGHTKISRATRVVKTESGDPAFEAQGMIVLDEAHPHLPSLPPGLLQAWLRVRDRLGLPIFLSLNAGGTYLGISTGDGPLPLDYDWATRNDPKRIATDLSILREIPWAIDQFTSALTDDASAPNYLAP